MFGLMLLWSRLFNVVFSQCFLYFLNNAFGIGLLSWTNLAHGISNERSYMKTKTYWIIPTESWGSLIISKIAFKFIQFIFPSESLT